jgi:hypothetical protein
MFVSITEDEIFQAGFSNIENIINLCKREGRYENGGHHRTTLNSTVKISSQITQAFGKNYQISKI